ncbi:AAA family ATPase [Pseudonocardia kunmingensis]|uniref:CO dehydrogenase maturation factor n=1 Tax=Pseudonocardia kunmingensis TaxID=630975 RepID=A0A543DP53_9PSEU|nr:AAA family ATPase [Pseudonocardia kunmingensis]TQM11088.1 CO dehydrogenase maturation factor [Pseudonocardia kunmingensis]
MIVAVAGKGGAGKTTISATLTRLLARAGRRVVAIDADSNPNLAAALGVREQAATADWLPETLVSRKLTGPALVVPVDKILERYAVAGPDGVRLLLMGMPEHAEQGCLCGGHATVSALLSDLGADPEVVAVVDMEASPEHLSRGTARHADLLLLVAEPYFRSLESVRRQAVLAAELPIGRVEVVANKIRRPEDAEAIADFCDRHGLRMVGEVPWSDAVTVADGRATPLVDSTDLDGAAAVIEAVGRLSARMTPAVTA